MRPKAKRRAVFVMGTLLVALVPVLLISRKTTTPLEVVDTLTTTLLPTAVVAFVFALWLVRDNGLAPPWQWLLAGAAIPIVALIGFFMIEFLIAFVTTGYGGFDFVPWLAVALGSTITVPFGLAGIFVVRHFTAKVRVA